jgi:hypothetical protein
LNIRDEEDGRWCQPDADGQNAVLEVVPDSVDVVTDSVEVVTDSVEVMTGSVEVVADGAESTTSVLSAYRQPDADTYPQNLSEGNDLEARWAAWPKGPCGTFEHSG